MLVYDVLSAYLMRYISVCYANAYNPNNEEKEQKIVYNYYIIYKLYMQHQNDV